MSLLCVDDLEVWLGTRGRETRILRGISMSIEPGQTLGLIGESGSGKSMTALAIAGLLPGASRIAGSIRFRGIELPQAGEDVWREQRGRHMSMIFQEPMTALNPVLSVGFQLGEIAPGARGPYRRRGAGGGRRSAAYGGHRGATASCPRLPAWRCRVECASA
jgi:ABC-type dipeptide/oligopeptide/nickel transport system ATPase component